MSNYTAAHESHNRWLHPFLGPPYRDLSFPDRHIEADNRLSWMTGTLDRLYGDQAFYVHLMRPTEEVAQSLVRRGRRSILYAFASGILQYYEEAHQLTESERYDIARQYCDTVNDNIRLFLRDKRQYMTMWLTDIKPAFEEFWHAIGAEGDLQRALAEWDVRHNVSKGTDAVGWSERDHPTDERWQRCIDELCGVIPEGRLFVLADDGQFSTSRVIRGRPCLPFIERHDQYWGPPETDEAVAGEIQRLLGRGAEYFLLAWPAFWYREAYPSLISFLDAHGRCLYESENMCLYQLTGH